MPPDLTILKELFFLIENYFIEMIWFLQPNFFSDLCLYRRALFDFCSLFVEIKLDGYPIIVLTILSAFSATSACSSLFMKMRTMQVVVMPMNRRTQTSWQINSLRFICQFLRTRTPNSSPASAPPKWATMVNSLWKKVIPISTPINAIKANKRIILSIISRSPQLSTMFAKFAVKMA